MVFEMSGLPKYDKPEKMQKAIDAYFETLKDEKGDVKKPPTISGLAYALGFESRQSFYAYEKKDSFSYTIKRARLKIEQFLEHYLYTGKNITGAIFNLKVNFGWREEETALPDSNITINYICDNDN